jgi:hypothetical protein
VRHAALQFVNRSLIAAIFLMLGVPLVVGVLGKMLG